MYGGSTLAMGVHHGKYILASARSCVADSPAPHAPCIDNRSISSLLFFLLLAAVPVAQLTVGWMTGTRSSRCAVASVLKRGCIVPVPSLFFQHHPRLHAIVRSAYCKRSYACNGTCAPRERSGDALAQSLDASLACAPAPPAPRLATCVSAQRAHVPPGLPRTSSRGARGI